MITKWQFLKAQGIYLRKNLKEWQKKGPLQAVKQFFCRKGSFFALKKRICLKIIEGRKVQMVEGYCMKCKAKKVMVNAKQDKMANGRDCVKGKCPDCGTSMFKIGKAK